MNHSACFIGHREISDTPQLRERLRDTLLELIKSGTVCFIFGDHSAFNRLCYEKVTELQKEHPEIIRIQFRKDYEDADDYTMQFLISGYEESICPKNVGKAGRASYVERNQAMIRESEVCVFYYDEKYLPPRKKYGKNALPGKQAKSGTAVAYAYAVQKKKRIYNLWSEELT